MPLVIQPTSEDSARLKLTVATPVPLKRGLSSDEARNRLKALGSNAIADVSQHAVRRALGKLWAPVPWMLEAAILLQLFLGDYVEAGVVTLLLVAMRPLDSSRKAGHKPRLTRSNRGWRSSQPCNGTERWRNGSAAMLVAVI